MTAHGAAHQTFPAPSKAWTSSGSTALNINCVLHPAEHCLAAAHLDAAGAMMSTSPGWSDSMHCPC